MSLMDLRGMASAVRRAVIVIGGPAAVGAALGARFGAGAMMGEAVVLPAIVVGMALVMVPSLYIGAALIGVAPGAGMLAVAAGRALGAGGTLLLGLAPATAFVVSTVNVWDASRIVGPIAFAAAGAVAMRAFHEAAFAGTPRRGRLFGLLIAWTAVFAILEADLLDRTFTHFN